MIGWKQDVNGLMELSDDWDKFDALDDFIQDQEQSNELIQFPNKNHSHQ
jgi:hypothetical protein